METAKEQIIQQQINHLDEIQGDIRFLMNLIKKLNPNKASSQEVIKTINEELSFLGMQRENLYQELEDFLLNNPSLSSENLLNALKSHTKRRYKPMKPPLNDIFSSFVHKKENQDNDKKQVLASGSESLV